MQGNYKMHDVCIYIYVCLRVSLVTLILLKEEVAVLVQILKCLNIEQFWVIEGHY